MNLFDNEREQSSTMMNSSNTTDSLKNLIQEQSEKLEIALSTNQELLQQNQNLQEENRGLRIQLCETQRLNQKLYIENDSLRNRNGLMQRKQQEQLERKIEDVQAQNSKLEDMVNMSNVAAVEVAEKERDAALGKLKAEKRKSEAMEKRHKEELGRFNKKAHSQIKKLKRELDFWRGSSVVLLAVGIFLAYQLIM